MANLDITFLQNEQFGKKLTFFLINGDFRNLDFYRDILRTINSSRLFCFLGGTLGNFFEREVIEPIEREMTEQDFFLLGVDLIGNRSNKELMKAYDNIFNKKFLFNPLAELGYNFERCVFKCEIKDKVSEVLSSKTIISRFTVNGIDVQIAMSTKYSLPDLKYYLKNQYKFRILKDITNDDGTYVLLLLSKIA